jgi:hypothetical protein
MKSRAGGPISPISRCAPSSVSFAATFSREGRRKGSSDDRVQDSVAVALDDGIREPHDAEVLTGQPVVALGIPLGVVERPVSLDDQAMSQAEEVGDIGTDWNLPLELQAFQLAVAEGSLRIRRA